MRTRRPLIQTLFTGALAVGLVVGLAGPSGADEVTIDGANAGPTIDITPPTIQPDDLVPAPPTPAPTPPKPGDGDKNKGGDQGGTDPGNNGTGNNGTAPSLPAPAPPRIPDPGPRQGTSGGTNHSSSAPTPTTIAPSAPAPSGDALAAPVDAAPEQVADGISGLDPAAPRPDDSGHHRAVRALVGFGAALLLAAAGFGVWYWRRRRSTAVGAF